MPNMQQFVLLPSRGLKGAGLQANFLSSVFGAKGLSLGTSNPMKLIDSIREDGAKLVEMTPESALALKSSQPGVRVVPVVYYRQAVMQPISIQSKARSLSAGKSAKVTVRLVTGKDRTPVPGAKVVAFTNYDQREGAQGVSSAKGTVTLTLLPSTKTLERVYVFPEKACWSLVRKNVPVTADLTLVLNPLDLGYKDCLRYFYGVSDKLNGAGVRVGVVDSGVDTGHQDLRVDGGVNTVVGEDPKDYGDNGGHHGTHVAGIIAARGTPPKGIRGVAPKVTLRSYRVFGKNEEGASNYSIAKAIDFAVRDKCDLLNLSLGGGQLDEAVTSAIEDARNHGTLVIAASGNDGRQPVSFPASYTLCVAVSALGRKGTFPKDSWETELVAAPYAKKDKNTFIATFSNIGPEIDLTGCGVGVISTVPGGYATMSGTSMACPAVTGFTAALLSSKAAILGMRRNQARADAMASALLSSAKPFHFGVKYEGHGFPR